MANLLFVKVGTIIKLMNVSQQTATRDYRFEKQQVAVPGDLTGLQEQNMPVLRENAFVQLYLQQNCDATRVICFLNANLFSVKVSSRIKLMDMCQLIVNCD